MEINYSKKFIKNYKKRIVIASNLDKKLNERVRLFVDDKSSTVLKDHALSGKQKGLRSFSIAGDVRVVYFEETKNSVTFVDIGSHNQVYGK